MIAICGVRRSGWIVAMLAGNSRSRPMEKATREEAMTVAFRADIVESNPPKTITATPNAGMNPSAARTIAVSPKSPKNRHEYRLPHDSGSGRVVLDKGLDAGTAFEILSIDIADVDVGKNVGAHLQADQAEADLRVAQARAETRRAMAVAEEQEMTARVAEMRAKVVEAEAQVPKAMAQAFREGNLGIMDYYSMRNIQADTGMRESISGGKKGPESRAPEK